MQTILLLFFVLAVSRNALGTKESERYLFSAAASDSLIVHYLYRVVLENENSFQKVFHDTLHQPLTIYLPPSDQEYFKRLGGEVPDWSGGVAFPQRRLIVLKPGMYFDRAEYRQVLLHELSHIYLADKDSSARIPLWFNEGVAMMMSGKTFSWNDHVIISSAVIADKLLDLQDMEKMLIFGQAKAQLAYAQSLLAVQFLKQSYGTEIIGKLISGLSGTGSWDQIFERYTGSDADEFSLDLQKYIRREYRWAFIFQLRNIFWIIMALLLAGGFFVIKIRNRRLLREWENNENV